MRRGRASPTSAWVRRESDGRPDGVIFCFTRAREQIAGHNWCRDGRSNSRGNKITKRRERRKDNEETLPKRGGDVASLSLHEVGGGEDSGTHVVVAMLISSSLFKPYRRFPVSRRWLEGPP